MGTTKRTTHVKRDLTDAAKLRLGAARERSVQGDEEGYLPVLDASDPINPQWVGQESTAFPDNWSVGMSFYHNLFAREHNAFVDAFRKEAARAPIADAGLRDPARPSSFATGRQCRRGVRESRGWSWQRRLPRSHTMDPALLYEQAAVRRRTPTGADFPRGGYRGNCARAHRQSTFGASTDAGTSGSGIRSWRPVRIFGLGSRVYAGESIFAKHHPRKTDLWSLKNPDHVNGGVNHFGSPFNFPEEFVSVYRLHAMVPDLIEYRELGNDPNKVHSKIPVVATLRANATQTMRQQGMANWALSMGRQRLGMLTLQNHPQFLQNLSLPRLQSATRKIDVVALDIVRDRERGIPRFNEISRNYSLKQLSICYDFVDHRFLN
jgi:hypothetical protein